MSKTVLITRPYEDAYLLAAKISKLGFNVISEPLLKIEPKALNIDDIISTHSDSVLLITSANSLRAFANLTSERNFKILTIGSASLEEAKNLGFVNSASIIETGEHREGNIENMLVYILANYNHGTKFLYISGSTISYDLAETLNQNNFEVERVALYDASPINEFSANTFKQLKQGGVDIAIFYSKRTAEVFNKLCKQTGVKANLQGLQIITLSQKITNLLIEKGWSNIQTANLPDETSIIEKLKAMSVEQKTIETKPKQNLWKFFIPFTFFLLSLVLIFQNILLNKKIDAISQSITDNVSKNMAKIAGMDEKISTVLSGFDTTPLKDNKQNFDEIKALLQDMRGLSFDNASGPKDIIVESTAPVSKAEYISSPAPSKNINVDQYIAELDKIETQLATYDSSYEQLRKLVYDVIAEVLAEHNARTTGASASENQEKSIISGFVKVRKITETKPDAFVDKINSAAELFEAGDYISAHAVFEEVNLEAKNPKISELSAKLKEFAENSSSPEQLLTKLSGLVKGLKAEISK